MDRRVFLGKMAALGALGISLEASGAERTASAFLNRKRRTLKTPAFDDNLVCILSDLHMHPDWHQEKYLAGMKLTLTMGNHDRRAPFAESFPIHAAATLYEQAFFFPGPLQEGEEKPALWAEMEREHKGALCVFPY